MQIFDFTVNTQNATKEDFDNAVDVLRYVDYISQYSSKEYKKSDVPSFLSGAFFDNEDDEITAKDFEIIIKSIYVFIERCYDFYPPTSNFMFPYRKYNMQSAIERYLDIYILMEFMKKHNLMTITYDAFSLEEMTPMQKNISRFVNTSDFLRAFIISYKDAAELDIEKYKDFGKAMKDSTFDSGLFPLESEYIDLKNFEICKQVLGKETDDALKSVYINFIRMIYCLNDDKLYANWNDSLETMLEKYFSKNPKQQETFKELLLEYKNNLIKREALYKTIHEYRNDLTHKQSILNNTDRERREYSESNWGLFQSIFMPSKYEKRWASYTRITEKAFWEIKELEEKIDITVEQAENLSTLYKIKDFFSSLPNFITYEEVSNK